MSNVSRGTEWYQTPVAVRIINDKYLHEDEKLPDALDGTPAYRTDGAVKVAERLRAVMLPNTGLGDKVYEMFLDGSFSPGGRSLYGAFSKGKFKATMSNCFLAPMLKDSIEDIMDRGRDMGRTFSYGGGVGVNFSGLRPNGAKVHNSAKTSTGPCSYMAIYDAIGRNIGSQNRRAAMLFALSCEHPDIEEYLTLKQNSDQIKSANLSILYTDTFMKAVECRENFTLHFDVEASGEVEQIRKEINAYDFFHKFAESQHSYAEPGAIWIDTVRAGNYVSAYPESQYRIDVANPCGEVYGNANNSCNLASLNLYNYVLNPFTEKARFDTLTFKKDVTTAIFILDALLDYGYDMLPLDEHREVLKDWRAVGLGIMGLADMLVAMGIKYGSSDSKNLMDSIMKSMQITSIEATVELAKQHGPFPMYDFAKVSKSALFRQLPPATKALVKEHGMRNCNLLSIAPTGSLSSMLGISGGAEPFFQISFERTTHAQEDGAKETFTVFAKAVEHLLEANGINKDSITVEEIKSRFPFVVDAHDVPWKDRVELQATMQKYVDNAISSTINLPEETSVEDIVNIYLHAWRSGCKGITIFRHNCLRPSILGVSEAAQDEEKYGLYGVNFDSITPLKRKNLPEETEYKAENAIAHTACVKNMHGFITTLDDNLFEAFTFPSGGCTANIATITRLCSLAFRSGVKVSEVLSELRSTHCAACLKLREQGNDNISKSCGGAIADIIEKCYHKELAERPELSDMKLCPKCGKKAMMPGKCGTCANCGYNACT